MTLSPCGGLMQEISSGRCSEPDHGASGIQPRFLCPSLPPPTQAKWHFVLCASDFVTGSVLCSPHPPAPALRALAAPVYLSLLISSFSGCRQQDSQLNGDTPAQLHVSWNFHFTNTQLFIYFSCFCNNSQWPRCHVSRGHQLKSWLNL